MNIIFWALVVAGLFLFWLCCAMGFRALGKPIKHLLSVAKDEIEKSDEDETEETKQ